ncbi:MAG: ribonuclease P protein component [Armatimonadetes bacterium]|nr:ribonuclease P protein component [Armatimonadota bacterium]
MAGLSKARFEQVFQEGLRVQGTFCRLSGLKGTGLLGIATPKKLGSSPRRNRLKRRLKEAVRLSGATREGLDIVIIGVAAALDAPFKELQDDLAEAFRKLHKRWENDSPSG